MGNEDVSIDEMLGNMANPAEQAAKKVDCPISGCDYEGEPESVSGHVSGSSLSDHTWSNTRFEGWEQFNSEMKQRVEQQLAELDTPSSTTKESTPPEPEDKSVEPDDVSNAGDVTVSDSISCLIDSCDEESDVVDIAVHIEEEHSWDDTQFDTRSAFFDWVLDGEE